MVKLWYNSVLSIPKSEDGKNKTYLIGGVLSDIIPNSMLIELTVYKSRDPVLYLFF